MSSEDNASSIQEAGAAPESPVESAELNGNPADSRDVNKLLESMEKLAPVVQGGIVQGKVLKVTETEVIVDIGLKSEAAVARSEFLADDGKLMVALGDVVDLTIDSYDEMAGTVSVSHQKAAQQKVWEEVERAFQEQKTLPGRVLERIKGGLMVDIGVRAFLPGSHADTRPHSNLDALTGKEICCKVIKFNKKRNNVMVSRKLTIEEESARRKTELQEQLIEGAEVTGRVKNLTDYGAFIDLGGMDGLLHITDLSWGRVGHPTEVIQLGQEIKVKILKYDREKDRVSLGLKQLSPDPWDQALSALKVGDRVKGRVVSLTDYGAFVELAPGVEGLIHASEMTWSKRLRHPSKIVSVGEEVEILILETTKAARRISLSRKQTQPDPWVNLAERFRVGSLVEGRVRNLAEFGAFVELEEGVEGLIHLSNLSWDRNLKHPSELLVKGQKITVAVLSLDPAEHRLSLGLKQLEPDIWQEFYSQTKVGDVVRGKVARMAPFGGAGPVQMKIR
jgi:small subunit ribosomal protein S1